MILQSFATFAPALIAGFGLIHLLWDDHRYAALSLKMFLGVGLGLGITSCLYFLRLLLFSGQGGYLPIQIGFLLFVLIALFVRRRLSFRGKMDPVFISWTQILLGLATVIVLMAAVYYSLVFARVSPHGDYDAQAIWNLRARFIYRSGDAWRNAFSSSINRNFHMDYPLLIPLSVVGGWNTLGGEVLRVPSVLSMLFLFSAAGIIYSALIYLRSNAQATIASIILLATPLLLLYSTFQTADIPLSYFFLASMVLFILACNENNSNLLLLSGVMAALSAWTKNEGLPFALIVAVGTTLTFDLRKRLRTLLILLAGMAVPLCIIALFKSLFYSGNDLFVANGLMEIISKVFDVTRYITISKHLITELFQLGGWPFSIVVVLIVYGSVMGRSSFGTLIENRAVVLPFSQLAIYFLIYLVTPRDLEWHISYSMSRLLIQLFPMFLLSFFLWVNTPENALGKEHRVDSLSKDDGL